MKTYKVLRGTTKYTVATFAAESLSDLHRMMDDMTFQKKRTSKWLPCGYKGDTSKDAKWDRNWSYEVID